jgi:hypothetical protein
MASSNGAMFGNRTRTSATSYSLDRLHSINSRLRVKGLKVDCRNLDRLVQGCDVFEKRGVGPRRYGIMLTHTTMRLYQV